MTEQEWLTSDDPGSMLQWAARGRGTQTPGKDISDRKLRFIACAYVRQMWPLLTDKRSRMAVEVAERYADGEATSEERGRAFNAADNLRGFQRDAAYACLRADAGRCVPEALDAVGDLDRRDRAKQAALLREVIGNPWRPASRTLECPECAGRALVDPDTGLGSDEGVRCGGCFNSGVVLQPWLTPQVLSLAAAAYEDRPGQRCNAGCIKLHGSDEFVCYDNAGPDSGWFKCEKCHGDGRIHDGTLDSVRLMVLADALVDEGCPEEVVKTETYESYATCGGQGTEDLPPTVCARSVKRPNPLLAHLRSPGPHVRGCFVLDLILGKE